MKKSIFLILFFSLLCYHIASAQVQVAFEIRNEQVVGGNYEFDVYMAASQEGTFHTNGQVYISFNEQAFGADLVANQAVKYTHLDLLDQSAGPLGPKYNTLNLADNRSNVFAATWSGNFNSATGNLDATHTALPARMTPLYHFSFKLRNPNAPAQIQLHTDLMKGQQFYMNRSAKLIAYVEGRIPTQLLDFTGELANVHDVRLNWATTNELASDVYILEKRKGEIGDFNEVTKVKAQGAANQSKYTYLDRSGMANVNYYRLKVVGTDGAVQYSDLVRIEVAGSKNDKFVVFPSPAQDFTTLRATSGKVDADCHFTLSDLEGRTLYKGVLSKENTNGEVKVDLSNLAEGTYYIKTTRANGEIYLNRLVKITH